MQKKLRVKICLNGICLKKKTYLCSQIEKERKRTSGLKNGLYGKNALKTTK